MKIKIKDLQPNPYRDIKNYPIGEDKVNALMDSIKQTGFWDNILARQVNGIFQIAYGHHRMEALKRVLKPDDEIDIPVKALSDSVMIKIMANENMEDWKTETTVIDETVKVAKKFLDQHPEEIKTKEPKFYKVHQLTGEEKGYHSSPLAFQIAEFLGWKESVVYNSLQRLNFLEKGNIDESAYKEFKQPTHADRFAKVIKKHNIPVSKQKTFAEKIKESESFKEDEMENIWIEENFTPPQKEKIKDNKVIKFESKIAETRNIFDEAFDMLRDIIILIKELGIESFKATSQSTLLLMTLNKVQNQIVQLKNLQNESTEFIKEDPKRLGN